jgi:triacylglycerol lipase
MMTSLAALEEDRAWWGNPVAEFGWPAELMKLVVSPVFRGAGLPAGDGSPVLVLPGFASSDASAAVLRTWLKRIGYAPYASSTTLNVDCSNRILERLERRLLAIALRSDQAVALIGHSRGGQLARALAVTNPGNVSRVIVLGSGLNDPFAISVPLAAAVSVVRGYHQKVTDRRSKHGCLTRRCRCRYNESFQASWPESLPLTSIRAARDGVVRQDACVVAGATNVEVDTTHTGLAFSPEAYRAIAIALADRGNDHPST